MYRGSLDDCKNFLGSRNGFLNIFVGVSQRHKASFVLRRCKVDTPLEHSTMPASKLRRIALRCLFKTSNWTFSEKKSEHSRYVASTNGMTSFLSGVEDTVNEFICKTIEVLVRAITLEDLEGLDTRSHGERISAQSASLVHRSSRSHSLHDILATSVRANRQTTTDDLAHCGHVRSDTEMSLSTAVGDAESRHDLIEDKKSTVLGGELANAFKKLLGRRNESRVADDRLQDHSCNFMIRKKSFDGFEIIVLGHQSVFG
mmetsp:Transcript_21776/g.29601  ORF Transcript_21776/g.29601 Transcript_21776/m.29601 type:complete len:258 (+) Transcript_21776:119-892(+)